MEEHENASQDVISNDSIKKPKEIKEREKKKYCLESFFFYWGQKGSDCKMQAASIVAKLTVFQVLRVICKDI